MIAVSVCMLLLSVKDLVVAEPQKKLSSIKIILQNPYNLNRVNEVISIGRNQFKPVYPGYFPLIKKGAKVYINQLVDNNLDGKWDNLLIEVSLVPNSKDTLTLNWVKPEQQIQFPKTTNVRFSLRSKTTEPGKEITYLKRSRGFTQNIAEPVYQMEGPGIENDKVAFRAFFDSRNGKDVYGKITSEPILEKVGVGASWHDLQSWGMDIFKTGNSLSAGALAVEEDNKIIRLADADTSYFQALYEGALQAAFKLNFKNWDVGTAKENGSETMSMTKGNFYYKNDIEVALKPNQYLVSGIANFSADSAVYRKHNSKFSSIATYAPQAEGTGTKLGVAIMFPTDEYVESHTASNTSSIPNTSFVALKTSAQTKKVLYFFACWEKTDSRFETLQGFEDYLNQTAELLANPIQIQINYSK